MEKEDLLGVPNLDRGNLDPNTRYALDVERTEAFNKGMGVRGTEGMVYNHAKVFVDQPHKFEALKSLTGELNQRRWAFFDLPKNNRHILVYDTPEYDQERLQANIHITENLDCSCEDKGEQMMREQEKAVVHAFCVNQLESKKDYDLLKLRVIEFLQG